MEEQKTKVAQTVTQKSTLNTKDQLDFLLHIVKRLGNELVYCKASYLVLLVVSILVAPLGVNSKLLIVVVLVLSAVFWWINAFFIRIQDLHEKLYNWAVAEIDAGRKVNADDLLPNRFADEVDPVSKMLFKRVYWRMYLFFPAFVIAFLCYYYF